MNTLTALNNLPYAITNRRQELWVDDVKAITRRINTLTKVKPEIIEQSPFRVHLIWELEAAQIVLSANEYNQKQYIDVRPIYSAETINSELELELIESLEDFGNVVLELSLHENRDKQLLGKKINVIEHTKELFLGRVANGYLGQKEIPLLLTFNEEVIVDCTNSLLLQEWIRTQNQYSLINTTFEDSIYFPPVKTKEISVSNKDILIAIVGLAVLLVVLI